MVIIPEYRSKSTPAIRITNAMVVSEGHGLLDSFTGDVLQQIVSRVFRPRKTFRRSQRKNEREENIKEGGRQDDSG